MKKPKLVYIFKYHDMGLGGIQRIILYNVKLFLQKDAQVVWIADKKPYIHPGYKEIINDNTISICTDDEAHHLVKQLAEQYDICAVCMSFSVNAFLAMSALEAQHPTQDIRNYLVIPHYSGNGLFLEENYTASKRRCAFKTMREFYTTLVNNGNLLFCNIKQAESFEKHYDYSVEDHSGCLLPSLGMQEEVTEDVIRNRIGKKNILSVCRFDFPHKSYVLGLIRAFAVLREELGDAKLTLIGYGVDESRVRKEIAMLEPHIQESICVIPGVPSDQLHICFDNATVSVGLAGAASSAAGRSLITLVARHYCEDCEVYGSYADGEGMTLREDPGVAVLPELRRVFGLSEEAYVEESLRTRAVYENYIRPRCRDIVEDYPVKQSCVLPASLIAEIKIMTKRYKLRNRLKYLKKNLGSPLFTLKRILKRFI